MLCFSLSHGSYVCGKISPRHPTFISVPLACLPQIETSGVRLSRDNAGRKLQISVGYTGVANCGCKLRRQVRVWPIAVRCVTHVVYTVVFCFYRTNLPEEIRLSFSHTDNFLSYETICQRYLSEARLARKEKGYSAFLFLYCLHTYVLFRKLC